MVLANSARRARKPFDGFLGFRLPIRCFRHQPRHGFAVPRDQHGFALLDLVEQAEQMGLGFRGLDGFSFISTSRFD